MARSGFKYLYENRGFQAFLGTQFLAAFNDNIFRTIVSLRVLHVAGGKYVSMVLAIFVFPALLFSGYAGYFADIFSKRSVLIAVKIFEVFVMGLGLAALLTDSIGGMLVVISLLGLHSAAFSPAKYGIVPEIIPSADLSRANALLEMTTFLAIVLGQAGGAFLFAAWKTAVWKSGVVTLAASLAGFAASLRITRVPASGARQPLRINPFSEISVGTKNLLRDRPLRLAVLGVSFFWFVAALLQPDLEFLGDEVLHASELRIGLLWTVLAIGLGAGNMLAGWLSGDKVELRLVPVGSAFMGIFAAAVFAAGGSYPLAMTALLLLAVSSGLFVVPLYACVQQRTGAQEKGRIIATNNFYLTLGMIIAPGAIWLFHDRLGVGAGRILLGFGVLTLLATACVIAILPELAVPLLPGRRAKRRSASSS